MRCYSKAARSETQHPQRQNKTLTARNGPLRAALAFLVFLTAAKAREVSLYVGVDQGGKPVSGLTAGNFRVTEDGKPVAFRLEPLDEPAQIVIVAESSQGSYPYADDIDTIMKTFSDAAPDGNWYALVTFARDAGVDQDFTRDREEIASTWAAHGQPAWPDIDTYDAVYKVLDSLDRLPGRRAMIVIGSGYDTYSDHTAGEAEKKAQEANVLVYSIGTGLNAPGPYSAYGSDFEHMHMFQGQAFLDRMAAESGGRAWFPESQFQDFNSRYRLVYDSEAPDDGKLHKIKVQVDAPGRGKLKVHVRKGWRSE
jgi:VWFA-related protein